MTGRKAEITGKQETASGCKAGDTSLINYKVIVK